MTEAVLDVVSEYPEVEHVSREVKEASVDEHGAEESEDGCGLSSEVILKPLGDEAIVLDQEFEAARVLDTGQVYEEVCGKEDYRYVRSLVYRIFVFVGYDHPRALPILALLGPMPSGCPSPRIPLARGTLVRAYICLF
ncbi:MAG: hypothetical protein P8Y09_05975 [Deltaproteobacteria bacterium]